MTDSQYPLALEGQTFIYGMNIAFSVDPRGNPTPVKEYYLKATNVIQTAENTWEFDLTGLPGRYETHYGWSLQHDTPENHERISTYLEVKEKLLGLAKQGAAARKAITSLKPESEPLVGRVYEQ